MFQLFAEEGVDFIKVGVFWGIVHDYHVTLSLSMGDGFVF